MKIAFEELKAVIKKAFLKAGLTEEQAELCAQIQSKPGAAFCGLHSPGTDRPEGQPGAAGREGRCGKL